MFSALTFRPAQRCLFWQLASALLTSKRQRGSDCDENDPRHGPCHYVRKAGLGTLQDTNGAGIWLLSRNRRLHRAALACVAKAHALTQLTPIFIGSS